VARLVGTQDTREGLSLVDPYQALPCTGIHIVLTMTLFERYLLRNAASLLSTPVRTAHWLKRFRPLTADWDRIKSARRCKKSVLP
jgi:hypothetical protein